jgi:hypothetical protein
MLLCSSVRLLFPLCLAFQDFPFYLLHKYAHFGNPALLNRASDLLYGVMQPPIFGLSIT